MLLSIYSSQMLQPRNDETFLYITASDISVVKEVEAVMDPAAFAAVRFTMSAIPFLPFVFHVREDAKIRNAGLELGLWISLGYLVEALGLLTSDAGRASVISLFTVSSLLLSSRHPELFRFLVTSRGRFTLFLALYIENQQTAL